MGMGTLTVTLGLGFVGVQYRDAPSLWKLKMRGSQGYTMVPSEVPFPFNPALYLSPSLLFLPFRTIVNRLVPFPHVLHSFSFTSLPSWVGYRTRI